MANVVAAVAAAVVVVVVVAVGDVDVDLTVAVDGMNVFDSSPEEAFHKVVGTFQEKTSSDPVDQCLVPYSPLR